MDLGVFQETKVVGGGGIHVSLLGVYWVAATASPRQHRGGVAVLYHKAGHFTLEALHPNGPNIFIFQLEMVGHMCHLMGFYIAPDGASTIEEVVVAIIKRLRGAELMMARDFNTYLEES